MSQTTELTRSSRTVAEGWITALIKQDLDTALSYLDRSRLRRGMVTGTVVDAFHAVGWGWGGSWSGSTKDYMHFSINGH